LIEGCDDHETDLKAEVSELVKVGTSLDKIKTELKLPKYQNMGMADVLLPWNIEAVFRELLRNIH
jgi:hypothetical protein